MQGQPQELFARLASTMFTRRLLSEHPPKESHRNTSCNDALGPARGSKMHHSDRQRHPTK
eukprot:5828974-Amphidinium_carterae.1